MAESEESLTRVYTIRLGKAWVLPNTGEPTGS